MWNKVLNIAALLLGMSGSDDRRPIVDAVLDNHIITGLIDTGSEVTAVSWNWFLQYSSRPKLEPIDFYVNTATNQKSVVKGKWRTWLKIQNQSIPVDVVVIQGLAKDLIIGVDVLRRQGTLIDLHALEQKRELKGVQDDILAVKEIKLLPGENKIVKGKGNDCPSRDVLLLNKFTGQDELYRTDECSRCNILLSNLGILPAHIKKGESLARVYREVGAISGECHSQSKTQPNKSSPPPGNMYPPNLEFLKKINVNNIPSEMVRSFRQLMVSYQDIFSKTDTDVGKADAIKQRIVLKDPNKITCVPPYRMAPPLRKVAEDYIDKLLASKIIQKS